MKSFSKFQQLEANLKEALGTIASDDGEASQRLIKDIKIALAIMDNLQTGAIYSAVRTTYTPNLDNYLHQIAEKISKNLKTIDKKYKNELKECVDKISQERSIDVSFTTLEDLKEAIDVLRKPMDYDPYAELLENDTMNVLIANLKTLKSEYDTSKPEFLSYREKYDEIAEGLSSVEEKRQKQSKFAKILGNDFIHNIFQGPFRDKIKKLVSPDSDLYRIAYSTYYGFDATKAAEERGDFLPNAQIEADVVTRFLLKDTGIADKIIDNYKSNILANNRFVKSNNYDKLKLALPDLIILSQEYDKIERIKIRKEELLDEKLKNIPDTDDIEEKKKYINNFLVPKGIFSENYTDDVINCSDFSHALGNENDGKIHILQEDFNLATTDFDALVDSYNQLVKYHDRFAELLTNFANPEINTLLQKKQEIDKRIANISDELYDTAKRIEEKNSEKLSIIPTNAGIISKIMAKFSQRRILRDLNDEIANLVQEREALLKESKIKREEEQPEINSQLLNSFKEEFNMYLPLIEDWGHQIDLQFILNYNIDSLMACYDDDIARMKTAYQKRLQLILNNLAQASDVSDSEKMIQLATNCGVNLEEPSNDVIYALKNFIIYLKNYRASDGIASQAILDIVKELRETNVSITEDDLKVIFKNVLKDMDLDLINAPLDQFSEDDEIVEESETTLEEPEEDLKETIDSEELVSDEYVETEESEEYPEEEPEEGFAIDLSYAKEESQDLTDEEIPVVATQPAETYFAQDVESTQEFTVPVASSETEVKARQVAQDVMSEVYGDDDDDDDYFSDLLEVLNRRGQTGTFTPVQEPYDIQQALDDDEEERGSGLGRRR